MAPTLLPPAPPYRPHIDGLRGVAIAAVLLFHAFPSALPGGFVGVDIFFVISGYLISLQLDAAFRPPAPPLGRVLADFYARRARRILPALILVLLAGLGFGYRLLTPSEYGRLAEQTVASAAFYENFLLARHTGYFDAPAAATPLLHLWSLAVEEQFYLLWPLTLWLALRARLRALPLVVYLAAVSFGWNGLRHPDVEAAAFFLPQMRLWEILIGAGAAALVRREPGQVRPAGGKAGAAAGVGALLAGILAAGRYSHPPDAWILLPTAGTALLLLAPGASLPNRVLSHPGLVWLGLISYPLYLWHWPLLSLAQLSAEGPLSAADRALVVVAAVALAAATYYLVERPVRRRRPTAALAGGLVAGLGAAAALAGAVQHSQGLPNRFPPLLGAISSFHYDGASAIRQGTYFLIGDQDETAFPRDPGEIVTGRPTLYLWGDSHAASLYPGLKQAYGQRLNVVQRTVAKTPPFLPEAFNPGNARQISQFILAAIARDRPEFVLLDANWTTYDWSRIAATIGALKHLGVGRVVVLGPVPQWAPSLPQALFTFARRHPGSPVPRYLPAADADGLLQVDHQLAALCQGCGAEYLSPVQALAGPGGYLVRTGDTPETLLTYDQGHLTVQGAEFLVNRLAKGEPWSRP